MSKNNNTIEINGKRYDASTGAVASSGPAAISGGTHLDGIVAPQATKKSVHQSSNASSTTPPKPQTVSDIVRRPAAHAAVHPTQPSKILMRKVVSKPGPGTKRHIKAQTHTGLTIKQPAAVVSTKPSVLALDSKRLQHARHVAQSAAITHFGPDQPASPLPISTEPVVSPAFSQPPQRSTKRPQTTADLLQRALESASTSTPAPKAVTHRRSAAKQRITAIALSITVIALAAFSVFQNMDVIRLHLASSTAGFSASLPEQQPAGYSLGKLTYAPGSVAMNFQGAGDNRHYTLTEKPSAWDSATLRDSFVASEDANYQTVESGGRTIYLYGQNNATWVDNGIWYQVESDGSLNYHQLVELASSL